MADQKTKKKTKKNVPSGVAHIKASFNNTIINISDPSGQTIVWTSGGSVGFKGSRKSTPYAAQVAAEEAVRRATEYGVHKLDIIISGTGAGRETAVRTLQYMGMDVGQLKTLLQPLIMAVDLKREEEDNGEIYWTKSKSFKKNWI